MSSTELSSGNRARSVKGGASPVPPSQNSGDIKYEMIVKYDRCVCFKVNFSRAKVVGLEF